jgi:hypothetical protein
VRVRVVDEGDEGLAKEEGHDREVVAKQATRRQPQQQADEGRAHHDHRDAEFSLPVDPVVVRGEQGVAVGADPEERDVAEVEETGEAHDDVQAEGEQRVEQGEQPVREEVALVHPERERRGEGDEDEQLGRVRSALPPAGDQAAEPPRPLVALLGARHPFVDPDPRAFDLVGIGWKVGSLGHSLKPSGSPSRRRARSGARA